jgi:glycosyltransferase involved in cell wall biosynthesis
VAAPLTPRHRRRLAELFDVWEVRNGARAPELNRPAAIYVDTHGGVGIGGSDDHAGIDVGRTWTQAPSAATPAEFLAHLRGGRVEAHGAQGSAAKWAHAAMAIAVRVHGTGGGGAPPDPGVVLQMVERVMSDGDARAGALATEMGPDDARAILRAWLTAIELELSDRELLAYLQSDGFSHSELYRRARRCHERRLHASVGRVLEAAAGGDDGDWAGAATEVFEACVAAIPYAPATAFLSRERHKLVTRDGEPLRVALVADGIGATHGVTRTLEELRERGVSGFEVEVIGTDAHVDRRLPSVAEAEVPFYEGLKVGVPSLPSVVEALSDGRYDLLHLCTPGPAGIAAALTGRLLGLPTAGSYHTELAAYAGLRSGDAGLRFRTDLALAAFYGHCDVVLSPSSATDERLGALGIPAERIARWDRGVDLDRFSPERRVPGLLDPARINVLYAGRLTREKGVDLLADAFLEAHRLRPALQLVLAGGGPEEASLRERLGDAATFLGWLDGDALAAAYASSDLFLFCSQTDTYGQVLLEAQASGLPVVAVAAGGPAELVAHGRSGLLCSPDPAVLGLTLAGLAGSPSARRRLSGGGLRAVQARSWEAALDRLAEGWQLALAGRRGAAARAA